LTEICYNQADGDYRREPGCNQSSLKKILESPAHFRAALQNRFLPTPAMEMGTALHCLKLDGREAFKKQYVMKPEGLSLSTKEGKAWKAQVGKRKVLGCGGKDDPWGSVLGMANSLDRLKWFDDDQPDYIKNNEVSIYWDWHNIKCKARLDRVLIDEGIVLDLKTTDCVEPDIFAKKVVSLGYDFQAAFYARAAEIAYKKPFKFIFVAVERKAPYTVDLFEVDDRMMREGLAKSDAAVKIYSACSELGKWPNKEPQLRSLSYPGWYRGFKQSFEIPTPDEDLF